MKSDSKYFRMRERPRDDHSFAVYSEVRPHGLEHAYAWMLGRPIEVTVAEPVVFERTVGDELLDLLLTNASQVLVSNKAKDLILSASTCARAYMVEVRENGHLLSPDYWVINFECAFSCMDERRSKFKRFKESPTILAVRHLVLDGGRIPSNERLFRLTEYLSYLICTNEFRQEVESAGLTGFAFDPVAVS